MNQPKLSDYCKFLAWDSEFFECRIAQTIVSQWNETSVQSVIEWRRRENIDCLYMLIDVNDYDACQFMPRLSSNCVDIRMTFERNLVAPIECDRLPDNVTIRPVSHADIPALKLIASYSYLDTRFYFDKRFPREKCGNLYQLWIERSCQKLLADEVFVAALNQIPVGYITCTIKNNIGTIGLVGVSLEGRGQGIGRQLVLYALQWFKERHCTLVKVSTQGRNILAQRVYERAGFLTSNLSLWYHSWQ